MKRVTRMKHLYEGPLPPVALTDYEAMSKFLSSGAQRCKASGRNFDLFLDWTIHALLSSLTADSAGRIFLPKTKTGPFELDDLIPLSNFPPAGQARVQLQEVSLIAPVWNNSDLETALEEFYDSGFADMKLEKPVKGAYFQELKLAVIDEPLNVALPYVLRTWSRGSVTMDCYRLKDLAPVLTTDGDDWYFEEDGEEVSEPVLEPRMAALYNCALRRYCQ